MATLSLEERLAQYQAQVKELENQLNDLKKNKRTLTSIEQRIVKAAIEYEKAYRQLKEQPDITVTTLENNGITNLASLLKRVGTQAANTVNELEKNTPTPLQPMAESPHGESEPSDNQTVGEPSNNL
ncbi:hypothetical protein ACFQY8_07755 [Alloscardovia venturai]|uniref:Uncharacterized protein n=1 Tax=Alloscardovia venturai TaxID=1769421 RepID=A0ABW2Y6A3_9BIFI